MKIGYKAEIRGLAVKMFTAADNESFRKRVNTNHPKMIVQV